ncbi:MAG: hypothetical protein JOZ46_05095 [Candidatus Dormibacteraeota bacterium]|nr:hypothetical protein [Candidatus Dormibacteraeota bacterium]MBV9525173.1 hypothetical protein [Candidatus Dormibacteraeota bacterium]
MTDAESLLTRLDAASERLQRHATEAAGAAGDRLTSPEPATGERWDRGQVWAHLAEFIPYWIAQSRRVIETYEGTPVPFGRTKEDPERIAAIEQDRQRQTADLWSKVQGDIDSLREFIANSDSKTWVAEGLHPKRGVMGMDRIVDEFLVGHIEEHANQLDEVSDAAQRA